MEIIYYFQHLYLVLIKLYCYHNLIFEFKSFTCRYTLVLFYFCVLIDYLISYLSMECIKYYV